MQFPNYPLGATQRMGILDETDVVSPIIVVSEEAVGDCSAVGERTNPGFSSLTPVEEYETHFNGNVVSASASSSEVQPDGITAERENESTG